MNTLVIDTANTYLVVALYQDGICLESIQELGNRKQSEKTILYIEKVLKNHNMKMVDIDEIIITKGPGSYTGVRVAMTIAKTIGATMDVKIKTVSSLASLAGLEDAIAIIDARSKKVFIGVYSKGEAILEDSIIPIEDFGRIKDKYPNFMMIGDGHLFDISCNDVDIAKNMYTIAKNTDYVVNIDGLVPEYLKDVEAKKIW